MPAADASFDLPVDPVLPAEFDSTPNEDRTKAELDEWWDRPFALKGEDGRLTVRCLDGGAWDRSTWYGTVDTLEEALILARDKLAKWRSMRSKPCTMLKDGKVQVVRPPQHPHDEFTVLSEFDDGEAATRYMNSITNDGEKPANPPAA